MAGKTQNTTDVIDEISRDTNVEALKVKPQAPRKMTIDERDLAVRLASASIADAIGLFMRSDRHKHMSIADLEWMLLPPLVLNQIKFAYARPQMRSKNTVDLSHAPTDKFPPIAVAMITWAMVSKEVAWKLDAQKKVGQPYRLAPQEWRSGGERRIIDAIGTKDLIAELTKRIGENTLETA